MESARICPSQPALDGLLHQGQTYRSAYSNAFGLTPTVAPKLLVVTVLSFLAGFRASGCNARDRKPHVSSQISVNRYLVI